MNRRRWVLMMAGAFVIAGLAAVRGAPVTADQATPAATATRHPISGDDATTLTQAVWVDTGHSGEEVPIAVLFHRALLRPGVMPAGWSFDPAGKPGCTADAGWLAPGLPCYAVVARFGADGVPFVLGSVWGESQVIPGDLYLAVNLPTTDTAEIGSISFKLFIGTSGLLSIRDNLKGYAQGLDKLIRDVCAGQGDPAKQATDYAKWAGLYNSYYRLAKVMGLTSQLDPSFRDHYDPDFTTLTTWAC